MRVRNDPTGERSSIANGQASDAQLFHDWMECTWAACRCQDDLHALVTHLLHRPTGYSRESVVRRQQGSIDINDQQTCSSCLAHRPPTYFAPQLLVRSGCLTA